LNNISEIKKQIRLYIWSYFFSKGIIFNDLTTMLLEKYQLNPILRPELKNEWESLVVCNPGVWYENGKFHMLYRAAGNDDAHVIRFGLAISSDGINFERMSASPVFGPSIDGPDSGCVEDARIVKFGKWYYITYAFRPYPPHQYWKYKHDMVALPESDEYAPLFVRKNIANSGLAITKDFRTYQRLGRITSSILDDRDVILFPEKIMGRYAMLHRPKEWVGETYGTEFPAIWIKYSNDILSWEEESYLLLKGRKGTWEEKVGGSTPPLKTDKGWLVLYHGVEKEGKGYYRVGAMMLDLYNPLKILAKTDHWIMEPEHDYEIEGMYKGCVFPTGNVVVDEKLYVYYGAADKYVGLATCELNELVDYLLTECAVIQTVEIR
jgi:beta-1,2-mannobiose phosphorylase / 1,2-beta-oligomannan phosphorylase